MAILVKDSFNRADSTNGLGQTETGQTWQTFGSVWGIQNNQAYPVNASLATLPFVVSPKTDNIVFQVKIAVYHWDVLIAYKIDNAGNTYLLERGRVYKNVNGAVTQLATIPVFKNDDVVKVRLLNNVHTIYINEAQVATFSDSAINGNRFGFSTYGSTTIRYDDFLIEDLSASESKSIQSDFSAKQVIHKQDTLDISIKSFIYKPTSLQIPTKQIICKQVITDFLTKQTVTTVLSHTIDFPTRQIIHKQSIGTLPTKQSIYIPTVSEHLTKQYMYISTQQDFRTKQALYKQFISDFSTKQNAFKQVMSDFAVQQIITAITNYIVDFATKQIIHKQSITDARIQQRVYKQVESIVPLQIHIINADAPELVGVIHLQGKRELFVYLQGKRDLTVNLQGKRELTIHLQGGLNMISNQNFSMISGDTKTIVINSNENLTGATVKWGMKQRRSEEFTLFKQGTIVNNEIHIELNSSDTQELSGKYIHECELTDQVGNVSTLLTGIVLITPDMIK